MADALEIKFDEKELDEIRKMLRGIPNAMPKVISRGINRTTTSTRAEIARRIAAEVKIIQSAVKKGIKVLKATQARWRADLDLLTKRIPLIKFGARPLKKGVSYRISKSGGQKKITDPARPFKQTMKSGHVGIFRNGPAADCRAEGPVCRRGVRGRSRDCRRGTGIFQPETD